MLDCLSEGRIVVCFLRGIPFEWRVYGADVADTRGATQEGMTGLIPFKFMDVDVAVRKLLHGVERNRPLIVFPFYARLLWWLSRLRPQIAVDVNRKTARAFRRRKEKP